MKTVYYHGPYTEGVEVPFPNGGGAFAEHGEPTEVPDELADRLLEQEIWSDSARGPKEPPAPSKSVQALAGELEVDLTTVAGSGKDGRIVTKDVKAAATAPPNPTPESDDDQNQPEPGSTEGE
jgi:pyruvate/2-oxoglutarate dehydrogenase complex dihydrolipoamide acyltransferase (E2) component